MANVYVFNLYNEPISALSVQGYGVQPVAAIPGYATGTNPPGVPVYTPASLPVPRSLTPTHSATFAVGSNPVSAPWDSFTGSTTVVIPDPKTSNVSLDDDLILLLAVNDAILLTVRGYVLNTFAMNLQNEAGETISAESL